MEEIRAKTLKGVQEQNCRSHCSFCPLHLLSPFSSTQAHSFQPRTNSNPTWPTSHLHLLAQIEAQCNSPTHFPFLSFSFLSPTSSLAVVFSFLPRWFQPPYHPLAWFFFPLAHHFPLSSSMQTPITSLAHHFPFFPLLVSCMNNPLQTSCLNTLPTCSPCCPSISVGNHLKTPPLAL